MIAEGAKGGTKKFYIITWEPMIFASYAKEYLNKSDMLRHLNLTDFEVGASCSIALQGKAKNRLSPRVPRFCFFYPVTDFFSVLLCTFFIYSFSFFQNIDRRIHIPVHPVSTFA